MQRIANIAFFDNLCDSISCRIANGNDFVMVPFDQDKALAAEQIREDMEADQRYYAEVKNNPMNYGALKHRQLRHQIKSSDLTKVDIPRQRPKVYDHGPRVDVSLEFLVSYAQKINISGF